MISCVMKKFTVCLISFLNLFFLNAFCSFAYSGEIKWIDKGFNTSDNYIQEYYKGFKEIKVNGSLKKFNISYFSTFPKKKYNKKNWECREWTIKEFYNDKQYMHKIYSLNDCYP